MVVAGHDHRFAAMMAVATPFLKETSTGAGQQQEDAKELFHSILKGWEVGEGTRQKESNCPATGMKGGGDLLSGSLGRTRRIPVAGALYQIETFTPHFDPFVPQQAGPLNSRAPRFPTVRVMARALLSTLSELT